MRTPNIQVLHGNCLDVLPTLPDCSVDSIVTDPPYELGFMGKKWDASGIAYNVELWQECLRVLKPGGHLLAFGGTRTYHRMACAIEDAGFEIRDSIHWLYGSGFPKSLDVSKAIDKQAGAEREVVGKSRGVTVASSDNQYGGINRGAVGIKQTGIDIPVTAPATDQAKQWSGFGTSLKPAHEPVVVARKPLEGTVAGNVLLWGTGALNIDASRIGTSDKIPTTSNQNIRGASYKGENADRDRDTVYEQNPQGRWPANVVFSHHEDCQQVGVREDTLHAGERTANFGTQETQSGGNGSGSWGSRTTTVGVWECVAGCPVQELDRQSGKLTSGANPTRRGADGNRTAFGEFAGQDDANPLRGKDSGGASRFFYCAKPSKRERNAGLDHLPEHQGGGMQGRVDGSFDGKKTAPAQNHHPTVKPLALMRYLVRLVTPPNGTVLEPFAGSGTTLMACILENFNAIGIEMTDEYLPIIEGRVAWAYEEAAKQTESDQQELPL